jgi:GGDEF domain-containing protein
MMVAVPRDVSEALGYKRALERLADLDPLTGLLNRPRYSLPLSRHWKDAAVSTSPLVWSCLIWTTSSG